MVRTIEVPTVVRGVLITWAPEHDGWNVSIHTIGSSSYSGALDTETALKAIAWAMRESDKTRGNLKPHDFDPANYHGN